VILAPDTFSRESLRRGRGGGPQRRGDDPSGPRIRDRHQASRASGSNRT